MLKYIERGFLLLFVILLIGVGITNLYELIYNSSVAYGWLEVTDFQSSIDFMKESAITVAMLTQITFGTMLTFVLLEESDPSVWSRGGGSIFLNVLLGISCGGLAAQFPTYGPYIYTAVLLLCTIALGFGGIFFTAERMSDAVKSWLHHYRTDELRQLRREIALLKSEKPKRRMSQTTIVADDGELLTVADDELFARSGSRL